MKKKRKDEKDRKNEELIYDTERSIVPIIDSHCNLVCDPADSN